MIFKIRGGDFSCLANSCANRPQVFSIQSPRRQIFNFHRSCGNLEYLLASIRPPEGKNFDFSGFVRFFRHIPLADQSFLILGQSEMPAKKQAKLNHTQYVLSMIQRYFKKPLIYLIIGYVFDNTVDSQSNIMYTRGRFNRT